MSPRKNRDFSSGPIWDEDLERYLVDISYPDGTRVRRRFRRAREASRFWATEQGKIEQGTWDETRPKNVRFGPALDDYREYCKMQHRSYVTYMQQPLDFWEEEFGRDILVAKITLARVERLKMTLAAGLERSTVNKYLAVLKAFFNWLIVQGQFNLNPVKKVKFFSTNNEVVRYLDPVEEYPKLLEAARETRWHLEPLIKLAVNTGLRKSNLLLLRWDECDFKTRIIRITQNTKNQETITIPMNQTVYETLKEIHEKTGQYDYVFVHTRGRRPGTPIRDVKNSFSTACKKAGIEDLRFHDLRHTFASWLVMNGVSLAAVQKLLGHKSIQMTLRYAHLAPDYLADEVKVLDKL